MSDAVFLSLPEIEEKLNYTFKNKNWLRIAMVHRSFWNEHQELVEGYNERLEFLGDSVLSLIVSEHLFFIRPELPEGICSELRAQLVSAPSCAEFVERLGVEQALHLGKGEQKKSLGKGRETILADFFEAIVGAIYLDGGYTVAKEFFLHHFLYKLQERLSNPLRNWKAELQDYAQKRTQKAPRYEVMEESGPSHERHFKIAVYIKEEKVGVGEGSSKKEAEVNAAEDALKRIAAIEGV